jgi:hypothetical protein
MQYECWISLDQTSIQYQETQNPTGTWSASLLHPNLLPADFQTYEDSPVNVEHYVLALWITDWFGAVPNAVIDGILVQGPFSDGSFVVRGPSFNDPTFVISGGTGLSAQQVADIMNGQGVSGFDPPAVDPGDGASLGMTAGVEAVDAPGGDGGEL